MGEIERQNYLGGIVTVNPPSDEVNGTSYYATLLSYDKGVAKVKAIHTDKTHEVKYEQIKEFADE